MDYTVVKLMSGATILGRILLVSIASSTKIEGWAREPFGYLPWYDFWHSSPEYQSLLLNSTLEMILRQPFRQKTAKAQMYNRSLYEII
jgi:hypothetical protein